MFNKIFSKSNGSRGDSKNNKGDGVSSSQSKFVLGIICGGPSQERGISLNSARSVADYLEDDNIEIRVFYVDEGLNFYKIDRKELYSNTPMDFEFKLSENVSLSKSETVGELKNLDMAFPVILGIYGEDGQLRNFLEKNRIPFVGSSSAVADRGFSKISNNRIMSENGFYTFPFVSFEENNRKNKAIIDRFFELNKLKKAIVKPASGGSSIGVYCVYSPDEALEKVELLMKDKLMTPVILEPFCSGREFTVTVLENLKTREPVALIPTGVDMEYTHSQILDYRRKYLPTTQTMYPTPANFSDEDIHRIQKYAEEVYSLFGFQDFVRMDGWLMNDGRIRFSDLNIMPAMEQNSFIFQQTSRIDMTHEDLLRYLLKSACLRQGIEIPDKIENKHSKKPVNILFGGVNAERQVSLMSGTNVWLKLRKSGKYEPTPFLLDKNNDVWQLPYCYALSHTVEEVYENCLDTRGNNQRAQVFASEIYAKLGMKEHKMDFPRKYSFDEFMKLSKREDAFVFLALHGGKGEDGTLQELLAKNNLSYNGSDSASSSLCMNKYETGIVINKLQDEVLLSAPKLQFKINDFDTFGAEDYEKFWEEKVKKLKANSFIIKPCCDGSSAGAVRIYDLEDFKIYIDVLKEKKPFIAAHTFRGQDNIIEMPSNMEQYFLLEAFIESDDIHVSGNSIKHALNMGWLELTVGVLEERGKYHSLNPSITIAENKILTVEEKFQGGTGVNITPPPEDIVDGDFLKLIREKMELASEALAIKNYARLDIFVNTITKKIILIEANTLPALTPSTVIFHQALKENPSLPPRDFIEKIINMRLS